MQPEVHKVNLAGWEFEVAICAATTILADDICREHFDVPGGIGGMTDFEGKTGEDAIKYFGVARLIKYNCSYLTGAHIAYLEWKGQKPEKGYVAEVLRKMKFCQVGDLMKAFEQVSASGLSRSKRRAIQKDSTKRPAIQKKRKTQTDHAEK